MDHGTQHSADGTAGVGQTLINLLGQISAIAGIIQPCVGFGILAITIGQFTGEMCLVSSLGPCLSQIGANRSGRSAYLIRKRILLLLRPHPAQSKKLHGKLICHLVNIQFLSTLRQHFNTSSALPSDHRLPTTDYRSPTPLSFAHSFASGRSSPAIICANCSPVSHLVLLSLP